ncbi:MAG: hypothetical protein WAM70_00055 [Pyrinomonadaceae bacterium]
MIDLIDELKSLVTKLDEQKIEYALCGGLALAIYDRARATADIDLLVLAESAEPIFALAESVGYTIRGLDMDFGAVKIRRVSKIDRSSRVVLTLDLLLVTRETQHIWDSRVQATWEGRPLVVVSRDGLIALKRLSGRPQDLADIGALTEETQ